MYCWKCESKIDLSESKVGFRAVCTTCNSDLHVCKNCKYYTLGKPNDCSYPDTLFVSDREKANFCEEFSPSQARSEKKSSVGGVSKRLFGEELPPKKKDFSSFFKDENKS